MIPELYAPTNWFDIAYWCREYEHHNLKPATLLNRFAIGFYQIHQGIHWQDGGLNKYESFSAAVLHFMMVMERLDLPWESVFKPDDLLEVTSNVPDWKLLLCNLSGAQQMLFYASPTNKTQRASRYNPALLCERLSNVCWVLNAAITKELRAEAYETSARIMTKELK